MENEHILQPLYASFAEKVPQYTQTQVSLTEQLECLERVANRLGLYDAADYLRERLYLKNK